MQGIGHPLQAGTSVDSSLQESCPRTTLPFRRHALSLTLLGRRALAVDASPSRICFGVLFLTPRADPRLCTGSPLESVVFFLHTAPLCADHRPPPQQLHVFDQYPSIPPLRQRPHPARPQKHRRHATQDTTSVAQRPPAAGAAPSSSSTLGGSHQRSPSPGVTEPDHPTTLTPHTSLPHPATTPPPSWSRRSATLPHIRIRPPLPCPPPSRVLAPRRPTLGWRRGNHPT